MRYFRPMPTPSLTPADVQLVQDSFARLGASAARLPELFYRRLFELDPSLRGLFHGDMRSQGQKLANMLLFIVQGLTQPEVLLPAVRELGARHANYRVKDEHYATVERALVDALGESLGREFTAEMRRAWSRALRVLSCVMIEASNVARASASAQL